MIRYKEEDTLLQVWFASTTNTSCKRYCVQQQQ